MSRKFKIFLAIACAISLAVLVYRMAKHGDNYMTPKMKIYNFNLDDNYVTINKDGQDYVKWTMKSLPKDNGTGVHPNSGLATVIATHGHKVPTRKANPATLPATTVLKKKTTAKPTIHKVTKKPTLVNLPPLTKPVTTKLVVVVTSKPAISARDTADHGGSTMCSREGEKLGKYLSMSVFQTFVSTLVDVARLYRDFKVACLIAPFYTLVGLLAVDDKVPASEDDIDKDWNEKGWVQKGGAWRPTKCQAVSKVCGS